jgi:hypothetical protein
VSTVDLEALIRAHEFRDVQPWTFGAGSGGRKIHARCWCGWRSVDTNDAAIARALHGEHVAFLAEGPKVVGS